MLALVAVNALADQSVVHRGEASLPGLPASRFDDHDLPIMDLKCICQVPLKSGHNYIAIEYSE